ncbi:MAG: hypothetical protein NZ533_07305 [Casimicrobiaceae bacterium]|nr:hypothetical protein [Casimicrobiaceae bacterium]
MSIKRILVILAFAGWLAAIVLLWRDQAQLAAERFPGVSGDGSALASAPAASGMTSAPDGIARNPSAEGSRIITVDENAAPGRLQAEAPPPSPAASARSAVARPRGSGDPRTEWLADLQRRGTWSEAMREAATAADPLALSFTGELASFCGLYGTRETLAKLADERLQPARLRSSRQGFKTPIFPTAEDELRYRENQRAIRQFCADYDGASVAQMQAAALQQLSAQGSPYAAFAKLFPGRPDFTGLNAAQFELIEKTLEGADLGTLALLGRYAQPLLNNYVHAANAQLDGAPIFGQNTGLIAWQLALCKLGAYCGADSLWARDACFRFGACGSDFASGIQQALARDGIDPNALEKIAAEWVEAIRAKDPARLNFRKAPGP